MSGLPASEDRQRHRLGILFVHGIGTQPQRETLVRWGDALVELITAATRFPKQAEAAEGGTANETAGKEEHAEEDAARAATEEAAKAKPAAKPPLRVTLDGASPGTGTAQDPAEVAILLETDDGRQESWLLTECWWADIFPPPTYGELVSWSVRAVPWSIALHVAQRFWQYSQAGRILRTWASIRALVQLLLALVLSPFIVLLLTVGLLLGLLPIPRLRSLILAAQSSLTATVGDSLVFVESPVRSAMIRTRVRASLARLRASCERTIVVAHSQGAAVVHEALGARAPSGGDHDARQPPESLVPDALLTFGAGINKLVALREGPGIIEAIGKNPVTSALRALLIAAGMAAFVYLMVQTGGIGLDRWLRSAVLVLIAVSAVFSVIVVWALRGLPASDRMVPGPVVVAILAVLIVAGGVARWAELPFWPLLFLVIAVLALALSVGAILGGDMEKILAARVGRPPGLRRWVDLYASADPVPNGPTGVRENLGIESVRVWNEGSVVSDHTTYWANRDEFVLRVARECAATAKSSWAALLPRPPSPAAGERGPSERRVAHLWRARVLGRLGWLSVFALIWSLEPELVPQPFELPAEVPTWVPVAIRFLLLAAFVVVATTATSALLRLPWRRWVRAEQETFLTGRPPPTRRWISRPRTWMAVVLAVLAFALQMVFAGLTGVGVAFEDLSQLVSSPQGMSISALLLISYLSLVVIFLSAACLEGALWCWDRLSMKTRRLAAPARKPATTGQMGLQPNRGKEPGAERERGGGAGRDGP